MLARNAWQSSCIMAEACYLQMIARGASPQIARSVLPTCLATTIVMTANLREWKHVFKLRTAKAAHLQMRSLMLPLFRAFCEYLPEIYDDIEVEV
jgi:thymidylate synthase (FAD)